jgi:hypothetical protein
MTIFRKVGKLYRRSQEVHQARLYPRTHVTRELERAGFKVRVVRGYGQQPLAAGHIAFVARKS